MAAEVVHTQSTAGAAAHSTLALTSSPSAGNMLVVGISVDANAEAPTLEGFTVDTAAGHHAVSGVGKNAVWYATRLADGTEKELKATAAGAGIIEGLAYAEIKGLSSEIDVVVLTDNAEGVTSIESGELTTTVAGDVVLAFIGDGTSATGVTNAWTSTPEGHAPTSFSGAESVRCFGGYLVTTATLAAVKLKASWKTSAKWGMVVVALKPSTGALIPINAAKSTSAAEAQPVVSAVVPVNAASSTSAAQGAVSAGPISVNPALSESAASAGTITAATAVPLQPASSESSAQGEVAAGSEEGVYYGPSAEETAERAKTEAELETAGSRFGDIYRSAKALSPIVILVHGGGFYGGKRSERNSQAKQMQTAGITVFNIDYLLDEALVAKKVEPNAKRKAFPLEVESLEQAIEYMRLHGATYNGDPAKIFLVGGSAGGYLVHAAAIALNKITANTVKGVVSLSGIGDLVKIIEDDVNEIEKVPGIWGKDTRKALNNAPRELPTGAVLTEATTWSWTKSLTAAGVGPHGALIFNSEGEETTPKDQPGKMEAAYAAVGARVTYTQVPGTVHSFSYWATVLPSGKTVGETVIAFVLEPLVEPAPAQSTSSAAAALTAATAIPLNPASSTSSAVGAVTVPGGVTIPLNAASSVSSATAALTAPTTIPLAAASSSSSAAGALSAATAVPLAPASSSSSAVGSVSTGGQTIPVNPASATSAGAGEVRAATTIPLTPAHATSSATGEVEAPGNIRADTLGMIW